MSLTPPPRVLLLYSTRDGQTRKIVTVLAESLQAKGMVTDVHDLHETAVPSPEGYDAVVIGASIRYGKFHPGFAAYAECYAQVLNRMPSAFVSVNLTARKPEKRSPETNAYTRKFLEATPWQPTLCEVAAGALRYPRYRFFDRIMIQLIMRMTGGPTDPRTDEEYTDWDQLNAFVDRFAAAIK